MNNVASQETSSVTNVEKSPLDGEKSTSNVSPSSNEDVVTKSEEASKKVSEIQEATPTFVAPKSKLIVQAPKDDIAPITPYQPEREECHYFKMGTCRHGDSCKYLHSK